MKIEQNEPAAEDNKLKTGIVLTGEEQDKEQEVVEGQEVCLIGEEEEEVVQGNGNSDSEEDTL